MNRTDRRFRTRSMTITALLLMAFAALPILPAGAHGEIDQALNGDPACNQSNFPGQVLTTQDLRQQFVPSAGSIASVDLCLNIITSVPQITLNIYEEGDGGLTGGNPGTLIRSTAKTGSTGFDWVHFDLDPQQPLLNPGKTHILEVEATQVTFQWRAACGTTLMPCSSSADPYPKGKTNFHPSIVDFGFRTKAVDLPDLAGTLRAPKVVCPGQSFGDTLAASALNLDPATGSGPSRAALYLSSDQTVTTDDTLVASAQIPGLSGGATSTLDFGSATVPSVLPAVLSPDRRAYLGLIVDDRKEVLESNETNNIVVEQIALTTCEHASISAPTMTVDRSTTVPGAFRVPIADVDADNLPIIPEQSATVGSFDLESTPILPVDLTSLFAGAPQSALDQILLSSMPYCCWRAILDQAGSPFKDMPLHAVSLADVLTLDPDVTLQQAQLGGSGLKGLTAAAILSAGTTLNELGPVAWCDLVECQRLGVDPARDTLLDLNLLGFKAVPWNEMPPVADMDLAVTAPLRTTRLAGNTATDHYQILQTPFRTLRVATLSDVADIVSCGALANGCGASSPDTLADAENRGAFKAGATVGQLLDRLPEGNTVTLGEAALGIFARDDLAWELMDYDRFRPQEVAPFGDPLTFTVRFTNDGPVTLFDPVVETTLAHNFVPDGSAGVVTSPADSTAGKPVVIGDVARFTTTTAIAPGKTFEMTFKAFPWVTLGEFSSSVNVSWLDAGATLPDHPHTLGSTGQAKVRVVDIETSVPNNEPKIGGDNAAPMLEPDTLLFTTIGPDDQDFFQIPELPAGSRVRVTMTSTAPEGSETDFDLAMYKLGGANLDSLPIMPVDLTSLPVPEDGWEVNSTSSRISPEMLEDLPILPVDLTSLSVNRLTSDESLSFTVSSGDGPLVLQVFGYNGSFGNDPVVLRVKVTPPPSLGPCTTPAPAFTGQQASAPTWTPAGLAPSEVNTLFVFDEKRTGDLYGPAAATQVRNELEQVAARADLGVKGMILSVDADARPPVPGDPSATVPTAGAAAASDRCSVEKSNGVVRAITSLMGEVRPTLPALTTVVVAGNNDVIPHYFARDYTWKSNEVDHVQDMLNVTGNTVMTTAMATRHFATDSPFGASSSVAYLNDRVFPPAFALGRLAAEDAAGVVDQLQRFVAAEGTIAPTKAAVASIDILSDGADNVASSIGSRLNVSVNRLDDKLGIDTDGWTADELRAATTGANPAPGIVSVGAHASERNLLAPKGGLFSADDVEASSIAGSVLAMSNGCHFGLNLTNRAVADAGKTLDWTEAYLGKGAAAVIGSSGFAYADKSGIAYSEEMMQRFAAWLGNGSLGDAWKNAVNDYIGALLAVDAFDHKTVGEFIFNGMPHYRIAGIEAAPPAVPDVVGPVAIDEEGLKSGPVSVAFDPNDPKSKRTHLDDGSYDSWDGNVEAKNGYAIVARAFGDAREPNLHAQDILVTGMQTIQESNFDPVFAGAVVTSKELGELQSEHALSPSLPARVTMNGRAVFRLGHFRAEQIQNGIVTGTLTRLTGLTGKVYYGSGGDRPVFERTLAEIGSDAGQNIVRLSVRMAPGTTPVKVLALFRDASGWHPASFTRSTVDPTVWTSVAPLDGTTLIDTFVQAVGPTGLIGRTVIKGSSKMLRSPVTISGPRGDNGWFQGPVTVSLDESQGVQYEFEVNGQRAEYEEPFTVTGSGINELQIIGSDHSASRATIPIDLDEPEATVSGVSNGQTFNFMDPAFLAFECADATSGIVSCTATIDGAPATTGQSLTELAGSHTLVVTALDASGRSVTVTVAYSVIGYSLVGFDSPVSLKPPELNDSKAGNTIPLKWKVFAPNGAEMTDLAVVLGVEVGRIDCTAPADTRKWGATSPAESNPPLRYAGALSFTATSDKTLSGKCSRYVAKHDDGSELMVFIRHTKA